MAVVSWLISVLVVALLVSFVAYLISLRRLPTAHQPELPTYDRHGHDLGERTVDPPR